MEDILLKTGSTKEIGRLFLKGNEQKSYDQLARRKTIIKMA